MSQNLSEALSVSPIPPLIERHVGDAAFYWLQHDQSATSALIDLSGLLHFDRLLQAHLDGITVAGDAGWTLAWDALVRWQGPGEVFVCAVLALHRGADSGRLDPTLEQVGHKPERMLRGLISALLWCDARHVVPVIDTWTAPDAPIIQQVAAWRAVARSSTLATNPHLAQRLVIAMRHTEPVVRAAACRAAAMFGQSEALLSSLQDEHPAVAAEAAIALASIGSLNGTSTLWQSVWKLLQTMPAGGLARTLAERRLLRWIQHLALLVPTGIPEAPRLLDALPPRLGLRFALHHADPAHLPWVAKRMEDATCARLAGWVWQSITGIDLHQNGLTRHVSPDTSTAAIDDLDPGLPLPDAQKIAAYPVALSAAPALLGKPLDRAQQMALLAHAPQVLRWNVAQRMASGNGESVMNIRARARTQRAVLDSMLIEATA
ncbi:HEAT repeat domain-containing protein [Thauera sp. SDU_THAU2]|uniref:HEAT repeat domain-containing protein n=1 Tax=Thauera sp. SDU_THAU2 TaxID=3136633 RepID=UPI00311E54C2